MTNKPTWADEFDKTRDNALKYYEDRADVYSESNLVAVLNAFEMFKPFISTKLAEQKKEIVEIIKTPMSTEFEDPEEESADYSIEDFRARLLNLIKQD